MPIISAESLKSQIYRVSLFVGNNVVENVVVSPDGLYNINYIKANRLFNKTGKIINIVQNKGCPQNSYILFDASEAMTNKRERILFHQVQTLKDVTPNDAYAIALKHGFEGSIDDWLASLHGAPGKSAYELAVMAGFEGTEKEWLVSLIGPKGDKGEDGKSAYDIAVEQGFEGSLDEWLASFGDKTGLQNQINQVKASVIWIDGM